MSKRGAPKSPNRPAGGTPTRRDRREEARTLEKQVREREKLARASVGGAAERPIDVQTASVIEVQAKSMPCPLCGGELRVEEHAAKMFGSEMLRVVRVRCFQCGTARDLFFRVTAPRLH